MEKNKLKISSNLIMCFLRHLSQEDAFKTLEQACKFKSKIIGIGLDSSELGNPPKNLKRYIIKQKRRFQTCCSCRRRSII